MNILVLTSMYPTLDPEYQATPICHYFATQWKKMGHNVSVAHLSNPLPVVYSWVAKFFGNYGMKRVWSVSFLKPNRKKARYNIDGIPIIYIPVIHVIPYVGSSLLRKKRAYNYLSSILKEEGFVPDYVIAHWHSMAYYMPLFKKEFPNVKTSVVLHNSVTYNKRFHSVFDSVDTWGFRSNSIKNSFEAAYGKQSREFICLSGVPSEYVPDQCLDKDFSSGINHFVYVGSLLKLKNIDIAMKALSEYYRGRSFTFDIVGDGPEMASLKALANDLGVENNVVFHGRLPRDKAQTFVEKAQVFVMVSSPEAFGLVYVEAMAKGCIPVAAVGQGADGFVLDGENGFLCTPKDVDALKSVIKKICAMDSNKLSLLSKNAYNTASSMTDEKVANHYLNSVMF